MATFAPAAFCLFGVWTVWACGPSTWFVTSGEDNLGLFTHSQMTACQSSCQMRAARSAAPAGARARGWRRERRVALRADAFGSGGPCLRAPAGWRHTVCPPKADAEPPGGRLDHQQLGESYCGGQVPSWEAAVVLLPASSSSSWLPGTALLLAAAACLAAFIVLLLCAELLQLCPGLCDPAGCSLPGSSVHGILQAWHWRGVAMPSSRGSSPPRYQTHISFIGRQILYH